MDETLLSYVRDFSAQVLQYRAHKNEENLALLNRTASLLSTSLQTQHLDVQQLKVSKFLIDMHAVMSNLSNESYALWSCIAMLQQCSRHAQTRDAIVQQYRFIPMLTLILERTQAPDKVHKLLLLLQELSYGIRIEHEEPFVSALLHKLLQLIDDAINGKCDELHAQLSLSILINLCYNNFIVLLLFLRNVNISQFSRSIKNFGMQATKLLITLSEDINAPDAQELQLFLRTLFADISESLQQWHMVQLRHNIDFLIDAKSKSSLEAAIINYAHYEDNISHLLEATLADSQTANEEQQNCMNYIFKLLIFLIQLNAEHNLAVNINLTSIYDIVCAWLESNNCGVEAVHLLEALLRYGNKDVILQRMSRDDILLQLIAITEKTETPAPKITAILQVLLLLLNQSKMEKPILSRITESYFDKMFAPLKVSKPNVFMHALSLAEIEKLIFCLLLLVNFADIAKKAYYEKCCSMLQLPQMQQALARAMLHGTQQVCSAIFQMSRFEYFPQQLVAKHMSASNQEQSMQSTVAATDQWRHLNALLKTQTTLVGKEIEERLQALVNAIENAQENNQIQNVATSRIVELFSYERQKFNASEQSWQQRMEQSSQEITHLTQRLNLQNAQLQEYHTLNFQLLLKQESLQTLCNDLQQQKNDLKRSMTELMKKLTEKTEALQISEKRLSVSRSDIIVLQKNYKELQAENAAKCEEYDKLETIVKENALRIENLKKTVDAYDVDIKEKMRNIEEKDRDLLRMQKLFDEQKDAKKRADDLIATLEAQLHEKTEQLHACEQELSETEELRKTIMSLMESKKPKRKL